MSTKIKHLPSCGAVRRETSPARKLTDADCTCGAYTTPGLSAEQERELVREAYQNFPEAGECVRCVSWHYGTDKDPERFRFIFSDDEGKEHVVKLPDAVRGLRLFAQLVNAGKLRGLGLPAHFLSPADDFDVLGEWDAFAFDALAQCAIFGEVIYG